MSRHEHPDPAASRVASWAAIAVGSAIAATVVVGGLVAVIFARTVVTPPRKRDEDLRILSHDETTITLSPSLDSLVPGTYSLWFNQDRGHARIGEIVAYSTTSVTRQLLEVARGSLRGVSRGRIGGWFFLGPAELGFGYADVAVDTELGPAPAWLIPAEHPSTRWMIGVHGRAVRREEALRAVPAFREAGFTSFLVSYRNDGDAPASSDQRYSLGDREWKDVEAAVRYAVEHGAEQIVLMGWSMGGSIVLQIVTRSPVAHHIQGVVLDSPVVDWITALRYQGLARRLPRSVTLVMMWMLSHARSRALTGQAHPIDFDRLNMVSRARELDLPILLMHSVDDGSIPATASRALAAARPDIVTYEEFTTARHTRLWNFDPDRWNLALRRWLNRLGAP
jgi:uncharacterized protein